MLENKSFGRLRLGQDDTSAKTGGKQILSAAADLRLGQDDTSAKTSGKQIFRSPAARSG